MESKHTNLAELTDKQLFDMWLYQGNKIRLHKSGWLLVLMPCTISLYDAAINEMDRRGMSWRILNSQKETIAITNSLN